MSDREVLDKLLAAVSLLSKQVEAIDARLTVIEIEREQLRKGLQGMLDEDRQKLKEQVARGRWSLHP